MWDFHHLRFFLSPLVNSIRCIRSFGLSNSTCWSCHWSDCGISQLMENVFNDFPLRSEIITSKTSDLCKQRYTLPSKNNHILFLTCLLSRLFRHPASRVVCRFHYSTAFAIFFFVVDRRCSSTRIVNEKMVTQPQATHLNIAAPDTER
jgi:hypothetical protein